MTDLAAIVTKHRAGLPLTLAELDALVDHAEPKPPPAKVLAERRTMLFELTCRHWPRSEGSWWPLAKVLHFVLAAPRTTLAGARTARTPCGTPPGGSGEPAAAGT